MAIATRPYAALLAAAAAVWLCGIFLVGSAPDEEEFRFAVLSAWLRVRAVAEGHHAFWTPLLGLGIPQPFVPNFALHPLAPLLTWLSPVGWVRVLLIVHTVIGAAGMWRLGAALALRPGVRAAGVVTFLLAAPVQNYALSDFWPSHYVVWTAAPWLLVMTWRVLSPDIVDVRRWSSGLGVTAGLVAASANPAYLLVFVPLAGILLGTRWRTARERWMWIAISAAIAATIAAPTLAQVILERQHFATELALSNVQDPLPWRGALRSAFVPFTARASDPRSLFFGAPYAALAVVGCAWFARARADLAIGMAVFGILLFTGWIPVPWVSQRYQFRDPLTLCGILLAGLALNAFWRHARLRPVAAAVLVLQVASIAYAAWPVLARMVGADGSQGVAFRGATGGTPLVDNLVAALRAPGRLAYSPQVDYEVSQRALVADGLGINALAYRGVPVVNGSFKAVSNDVISPDDRLFYGRVRVPPPFIAGGVGLDVLGVRYVLARPGEPVAPDLAELGVFATARGGELILYENADAWPGAFLIPAAFGDEELPVLPGCAHNRVLCRDLAPVGVHRDTMPLTIVRHGNGIRVRWNATREPRILVVTEMFRPEWIATADGRPAATRRMYGALLGVPLPAGVGDVRLEYRPAALVTATVASYVALLMGLALALPGFRRR